ncbi:MAG: hypothetical protein HYW07_04395 [Candidatus Latescibacteria bacterium]|nr:hypothetical protein [Candidatus Latescibacterota bacterium]
MTASLSADVLQDDLAVSLARMLAAANKKAREAGVDVLQSSITSDLIVEVDSRDASIKQVRRGQ